MTSNCSEGHSQTGKCHEMRPLTCPHCERRAKNAAASEGLLERLEQKKRNAEQQRVVRTKYMLNAQSHPQKALRPAKKTEAALERQEPSVLKSDHRARTPDPPHRAGSPDIWSELYDSEEEEPVGRDPGVTDVVWRHLQVDKAAAIEEQRRRVEAIERAWGELREAQRANEEVQREIEKVFWEDPRLVDNNRQDDVMLVLLGVERSVASAARMEHEKKAADLRAREEAEIVEMRREAVVQARLRGMGVCGGDHRWIKQADGYRCAAGGHFVLDSQLGL